ncbi:MAG: hypothetical protein JNJ89_05125 [Rubrivivax sp.]|nr:hypothetical protein [Rubrivivax sp.]
MSRTDPLAPAADNTAALADALAAIDLQFLALTRSLQARDAAGVEASAQRLATAVEASAPLLRASSTVPGNTGERLTHAMGRVLAQREALARASASVQRAMAVLWPGDTSSSPVYSASGHTPRSLSAGSTWA